MGGPLAGHAARVQQRLRAKTPFPELVQAIRSGPPRLSVMAIPGVDERANTVEYFVHHEDVRRAASGWEPRDLRAGETDALWRRLRMARLLLRKAPVGVELARDDMPPEDAGDGRTYPAGDGQAYRIMAKKATPVVTVIGSPGELTMWLFGRVDVADVRYDGTEAAVSKLTAMSRR